MFRTDAQAAHVSSGLGVILSEKQHPVRRRIMYLPFPDGLR
jgi:hypothetical protein